MVEVGVNVRININIPEIDIQRLLWREKKTFTLSMSVLTKSPRGS